MQISSRVTDDSNPGKYPNADREWGWQWAFPAPTGYYDKEAKIERRHHLHETVVQKAGWLSKDPLLRIDG